MPGYRTWVAGEVLTADNMQEYLQNQTVMPFASAAARDVALLSVVEGQLTFLEDSQKYEWYNGATWIELLPNGGTEGQPYVSAGTADPAFGDMNAKFVETTLTSKSAAYTAVAGDANTMLVFTASATATFPDVLDTVGDRIDIMANTTGTVTLAAGTGVTSWAGAGTAGTAVTFYIDVPYSAASVIKTAAGAYRVLGRIAP